MEGVDVSKYQGTIDWNKVKASGMSFAMVRQGWINSDGTITEDPFYRQNMAGAHAAGLHTGVYLYSYATSESAMKAAASACVAMLEGFVCDMPIALDFEHATLYKRFSRAANASLCAAFLSRIEELGRYCIL
jgi:GH25 family lysozyme M1 (1,4-beta-N-acetylmuramidase)